MKVIKITIRSKIKTNVLPTSFLNRNLQFFRSFKN
jgi:hypothetical protein